MSISLPKRQPAPTRDDIRKMIREEVDMRIETLQNLAEPVPEPAIPGLVRFAVDAFEVGSLAAAMVGAFALTMAKAVIR